jgi:hypothetical protein
MNLHPLSSIFPPMSAEEYERFADSIAEDGLLDPITLYEGKILDGRHRQRACDERGVEARYEEWNPSCGISPLEWVIARNLHRRQLTIAQKAALAVEVKDQLAEAARERMRDGGRKGGQTAGRGRPIGGGPIGHTPIRSRNVAAEQFGVGAKSVERADQIRRRDPTVFERLKTGEVTISGAQKLVGISDPGGGSGRARRRSRTSLHDAITPLRKYLKGWSDERLDGVFPPEARRLLKQVQEIDAALFEVERALEARAVRSRALQ